MASFLFYLFTFLLASALLFYGIKRKYTPVVCVAIAIPTILASLRYEVGTDYVAYLDMYSNLANVPIMEYLSSASSVEIGFYAIIQLSSFITNGPFLLFAASSFMTVLFFYLGIKRFRIPHPALAYFLFLMIIFPLTLNLMRQGIAMAIFFYALSFMTERKFWNYALLVIFAALFHMTALFLLPVYFLYKVVMDNRARVSSFMWFFVKLGLVASVIYFMLPYVFKLLALMPIFAKYNLYQTFIGEGANAIIYLQILILLAVIISAKWLIPTAHRRLYLFFIMFAAIELTLTTLGFSSAFMKRMAFYFTIFSLILMTGFVDIFQDRLGKFLTTTLVISYGIFYFYMAYVQLGQANIVPYNTIFGGTI